jgi:hypothetical protein
MSSTRSGDAPDGHATDSWTTETLPMSVRKDLLERELKKLGFRKSGGPGSHSPSDAGMSAQHEGQTGHPQAEGSEEAHGD